VPDVISDTSVIQYFFQVGLLDLLFTLYEEITIPQAVASELDEGRIHGVDLPSIGEMARFKVLVVPVPQSIQLLKSLGNGEREVLAMASASSDALIVLDDAIAREHARSWAFASPGLSAFYSRPNRLIC
jgi:predicted nucleic acid-binding protein